MNGPEIVSREEWLAARKELLTREKQFDRERDALSEQRRALPMVEITEPYTFEGPNSAASLIDTSRSFASAWSGFSPGSPLTERLSTTISTSPWMNP
ncbi:DUF899 family protein [Streptomyces parvus]|uniref:DUF899 family protein n=1 Tax=Streptomyces parvus TaxID=66428 RepID=UPI00340E8442